MCDFCDPDTRKDAVYKASEMSDYLDTASYFFKRLSMGKIKPHTDEIKEMGVIPKLIIKELIDYV